MEFRRDVDGTTDPYSARRVVSPIPWLISEAGLPTLIARSKHQQQQDLTALDLSPPPSPPSHLAAVVVDGEIAPRVRVSRNLAVDGRPDLLGPEDALLPLLDLLHDLAVVAELAAALPEDLRETHKSDKKKRRTRKKRVHEWLRLLRSLSLANQRKNNQAKKR